jgi:hypothetical protein
MLAVEEKKEVVARPAERPALYFLTWLASAHCGAGFNFEQAFFTRIPVDESELNLAASWKSRSFAKQAF